MIIKKGDLFYMEFHCKGCDGMVKTVLVDTKDMDLCCDGEVEVKLVEADEDDEVIPIH